MILVDEANNFRNRRAKRSRQEQDDFELGRQVALVGIFKSRFLKQLESSIDAFRISIRRALEFVKTFPYREVNVFEIQDKVIASILGDVERQEAAAIVNSPVAEEQALVSQVLQGHLNHPETDRGERRELRRF